MESTQIALPDGMIVPESKVNKDALSMLAKIGDYLPYINVLQSTSKVVEANGIKAGNIVIMENGIPLDLGKRATFVVFMERSKAMSTEEGVLSYYDITSQEFKRVYEKAKIQGQTKNMAGLEFLTWTPDVGEFGTFASLFCSNASLRRETPVIRTFLGGRAMEMSVPDKKISNAKGSWYKADFKAYTAPIPFTPDPEELKKQFDKFVNPPANEVEVAPPVAGGRSR